ncbi:MAG: adenylyltransferase/cytidyltransferase family protein [Candidatus Nanoarchaeia archaeon]
MKKVMVFGTFDMLHKGHENFLKQAKKHGDELIVVVARDKNVLALKGQNPVFNLKKRLETVKKLGIADLVIEGEKKDFYKSIWELNPDIICLGYDQDEKGLKEELVKKNSQIKIIRLQPYKENKYKTTIIRNSNRY